MKAFIAILFCLPPAILAGCSARQSAEMDVLNARIQSEQTTNAELAARVGHADADKAAAKKQVAELSAELTAAKQQLSDEQAAKAKLEQQLADAEQAKSAAEEQARKAVAKSEARPAKSPTGGMLRTIDEPAAANGGVPDTIRGAFASALSWRANQIKSLEIEMRDTPSKATERTLRTQLEKLRASPLAPAPLAPSGLTLGQIGPLDFDGQLRVDEVVDENTVVVTPIKLDPRLTPQPADLGSAGAGSNGAGSAVPADFVQVEGNPIAIHGFSTVGIVTGAKLRALDGLFYVQKTERYGSRTIFVLEPVDANKVRAYFNQLQSEMRAAALAKPQSNGKPAAK